MGDGIHGDQKHKKGYISESVNKEQWKAHSVLKEYPVKCTCALFYC